ncbi:protein ALP1-like [Xenia sp. Carnegie-2017]|uniref:protein ALP1-like n=1 Tax=Xenia sp. Carnegie-2017 TaxID=2897299 RepID=UPI001F0402AA|nr:protein ALP1-like [Xenia sp. Carnegie-2017]XP_046839404.1 protein ALP1-like [Xenia sp. Carnegie-2017]
MKAPSGPEEWKEIAKGFERWNAPNCIGSIDGKHVSIQKPKHSGSEFHNYEQRESIVLLAVCDANYKFTLVDIGQAGSQSDGGTFEASEFGKAFLLGQINLPTPVCLPNDTGKPMPFVLVGDEAFPLKPNLLRPYPGKQRVCNAKRIFNYRLSRARRVIENSFDRICRFHSSGWASVQWILAKAIQCRA